MTRYMRWLEAERGLDFGGDYHALWRWSVDELEDFWASIWDYFEVRACTPYDRALASREMPGAEWFTGARLNYAENLLAGKPDDRLAVQHASELRELDALTWGELREEVARTASALRGLGVAPGDRARSPIRRTFPRRSSRSSPRLRSARSGPAVRPTSAPAASSTVWFQIEPKVPLRRWLPLQRTRLRPPRRGRRPAGGDAVRRAHGRPPYLDFDPTSPRFRNPTTWDELLAAGEPGEIDFEQVAFDHPPGSRTRPGPPACRRRSSRDTRHPGRAAEEARPAPRRAGGRPGLRSRPPAG